MAIMMGLGPFRFSLDTAAYQNLERNDEYRWESQERIGRHPALQFIGEGHSTVNIDGVIYPHFRGGFNQIESMRAIAKLGRPLFLVSGSGRIFGMFAITVVDENQSFFNRD
ncbi:phage tail protein, partial [Klebsiella pneumoniae]